MSALTDLSAIINRLTGGNSGTPQHTYSFLSSYIQGVAAQAPVASKWTSLWQYDQTDGANGAAPTTVAIPDRSTTGALPIANPGGGRQQWLLGIDVQMSMPGIFMLYDRLLHIGNLSGTTTTAQTVGGTITRNTGGVGNEIWAEIYTAVGTTATTITASYTNQAGTSGRTTRAVAFGGTGNREAQRMIPLPLQDGDTGVQSIQSVTVLASTTTAGAFGVTLLKPLVVVPTQAAVCVTRDLIAGLPAVVELETGACVTAAFLGTTTTALAGMFSTHVIEA